MSNIGRLFGLTQEQAAKQLGVSVSTAERLLAYARAWLFREMRRGLPPHGLIMARFLKEIAKPQRIDR